MSRSDQPNTETYWYPIDPPDDFSFSGVDSLDFNPDHWPNEPDKYRPTAHFRQRFNDYHRALTGEIINDAITGGKKIPASDDCVAFYTTDPGIVYYLIAGWDHQTPPDSDDRVIITGWPYVYDRDAALNDGRYSLRLINRVQEINQSLFNAETADDDWLEYYELE